MPKPSAVITLTGILDKRFIVIEDINSAFGVYLVYNGKKYEPDITLHEVLNADESVIDAEVTHFEDAGFTHSGFDNIQGSIIKL